MLEKVEEKKTVDAFKEVIAALGLNVKAGSECVITGGQLLVTIDLDSEDLKAEVEIKSKISLS